MHHRALLGEESTSTAGPSRRPPRHRRSSPLVGDLVALSQALGDIEAIWDLGNAHDTAVVVVLAGTLEADNLIVQCHLLALGIAGLLPVGPARPHPAIGAVERTRMV